MRRGESLPRLRRIQAFRDISMKRLAALLCVLLLTGSVLAQKAPDEDERDPFRDPGRSLPYLAYTRCSRTTACAVVPRSKPRAAS